MNSNTVLAVVNICGVRNTGHACRVRRERAFYPDRSVPNLSRTDIRVNWPNNRAFSSVCVQLSFWELESLTEGKQALE